jgi:tetratricopeptide (TPR) repeat protein
MPARHHFLIALLMLASPLSAEPPPATTADNASAIALYRERKNDEARAAFEAVLAAGAGNAEAHHFLGLIALRENRDDDAVRLHENATRLAPEDAAYFIALGDAYGRKATRSSLFARLAWAQKCRASLEKAVALAPRDFGAQAALIEYYRRAPAIAGGGLAKARAQAQTFLQADLAGGTRLLVELNRREARHAESFAALDAALDIHPDDFHLLLAYGRTAADSGENIGLGRECLEKCLAQTPPARPRDLAEAWFLLGRLRIRLSDTAGARAAFETALSLEPGHAAASRALADLRVH